MGLRPCRSFSGPSSSRFGAAGLDCVEAYRMTPPIVPALRPIPATLLDELLNSFTFGPWESPARGVLPLRGATCHVMASGHSELLMRFDGCRFVLGNIGLLPCDVLGWRVVVTQESIVESRETFRASLGLRAA